MLNATCDGCKASCGNDFETWTVYTHQVDGDDPDDIIHGADFHLCHRCAASVWATCPVEFAGVANTLMQELV